MSRTSVTYPQRTQIQSPDARPSGEIPKCSGHDRRCKEFTAGPTSKNPGRKFYTCPLARDDPQRCKFFKWADEAVSTGNVLGQGGKAYHLNTTPTAARLVGAPITPQTISRYPDAKAKQAIEKVEESLHDQVEEIDWDKVDTDSLEKEAVASTPSSSQQDRPPESLTNRLLQASTTPSAKRQRAEDTSEENPFLSRMSRPHPALSPSIESFEKLSEHLHRQDRLIHAGEVAKEGFRKTIKRQQERIEMLEKELDEERAKPAR